MIRNVKMPMFTTALLSFAGVLFPLRGDSPSEREFKQLREQREKAAAAALEPINKRYQAALEVLLRRTTQAGDLETAVKIKEELQRSTNATGKAGTAGDPSARKATEAAWMNTEWRWDGGGATLQIRAGGQVYVGSELCSWAPEQEGGGIKIVNPKQKKATLRMTDEANVEGTGFDNEPVHGTLMKRN